MKRIQYLLSLVILAVLIGCSKDDGDKKSPHVTIISPVENQEFARGGIMKLDAVFEDDVALNECRVNLEFVEALPVAPGASLKGIDTPWEPEEMVIPLSETVQEVKELVLFGGNIPYNIQSGYYRLKFDIYDLAKNPARAELVIIIE
ncbi:DUF4625 domain-containing protein [Carboxylicivirga mesophila]|uniref:DUF4625 domain-containing protein n=1 Tax=Carboxylicivirga mesophila TaxID=1166478 RepID=A0ABS5KCN0_9BACT|nr:DUF4625 domain-containing protein [Carboxylicivirga mesophila]MBS2212103.1 DUF4625 domain-containing protein [Carboxylicivirga mesophila]